MRWWPKPKVKLPASKAPPAKEAKPRTWVPANRVMAVLYLFIVIAIARFAIPPAEPNVHYSALRQLSENTRLASQHLMPPTHVPLEAIFRLSREKSQLEGMYLRRMVKAGDQLKSEDVRSWPKIEGSQAIPVELDTEPDWLLLNEGTIVEVWIADKKDSIRAHVLAVVPSGKKWQVLLDRCDVPDGFGYPKEQPKLRILSLP